MQDLDQTNSSAQSIKTLESNGKFKITMVDPAINATQYVRDNKVNLVLVIPKGYERSLMQRVMLSDPNASVTITYVYDPSSSSVPTKMQILNAVFAGINQKMSGKPPFIRSVEKSILTRKYRFIEFFVPGIIAMAVMTFEPVRYGKLEHGVATEGDHQETVHHTHHPYRLDTVGHPVPVYNCARIHDCDAAGELRRV